MNKIIDNLPHRKKSKNQKIIDNFSNINVVKDDDKNIKGVYLNNHLGLAGSEIKLSNKPLDINLEKDDFGNIMSFLIKQKKINNEPKELSEDIVEDEVENFTNVQEPFTLDGISNYYFASLMAIMLFYIYRSIKR